NTGWEVIAKRTNRKVVKAGAKSLGRCMGGAGHLNLIRFYRGAKRGCLTMRTAAHSALLRRIALVLGICRGRGPGNSDVVPLIPQSCVPVRCLPPCVLASRVVLLSVGLG